MTLRPDLALIAEAVPRGARVLDVGCGDGTLLAYLRGTAGVDARGLEIDAGKVAATMARGLAVVQGDADADLGDYPDGSFDVAILSQTIQATRAPASVLRELTRVAARAIVSFPNFGHWRVRWALAAGGRMPATRALPAAWHDTANIHLCTIADFRGLVADLGLAVTRSWYLGEDAVLEGGGMNWRATTAIFELEAWR